MNQKPKIINVFEVLYEFIHEANFIKEPGYDHREIVEGFIEFCIEKRHLLPQLSTINEYIESLNLDGYNANKANITLHLFFYWLAYKNYMDPIPDIRLKNYDSGQKRNRAFITLEQANILNATLDLRLIPDLRDRLLILLLENTALSLSQISRLNVRHYQKEKLIVESSDKAVKSQSITLTEGTQLVADTWLFLDTPPERPLFVSLKERGLRLNEKMLAGIVKDRLNKAGIIGSIYSHDSFRHASIPALLESQHSLHQIHKFYEYRCQNIKDINQLFTI